MNPTTSSNLQPAAGSSLATASLPAREYPESREITLGDSPAIEMHVLVNGQIVRAVLSDASFGKSRSDQGSYAESLGGRLATREENRAVANDLLEKEEKGSLNPAETKLLKTYGEKFVRDSEGGLVVNGRRVYARDVLIDDADPNRGALVVLPLAESAAGTTLLGASLALTTEEKTRTLITKAGGIFIGKDELVNLGKLAPDAVLPEIHAKYSQAFLESTHPLRGGSIASHIILVFDPETNKWYTADRGEGGKSDIVPGSLGKDGKGLSGDKQDELLKKDGAQIKVEGAEISTHKDSLPIERILDNAVALHLAAGKPLDTAPFYGIWGRSGDTQKAASGCRRLLGHSLQVGVRAYGRYHGDFAINNVGLLAGWN